MHPTITYRVQIRDVFDFDDAADIAGYISDLGVTHLYCSPYLQSTPGSTHGYDVVDPRSIDGERGSRDGLERLSDALDQVGLGQIMDIVPNHMAAHPSNPWWWDVLRRGRSSPYASFFDIQWDEQADFKVLVPILSDHYGRVLEAGELGLEQRAGSIVVTYADHRLPLSPESTEQLRQDGNSERLEAELDAINRDPDLLDDVIEAQSYRLAHWRTANEELDYRRFFNIETLVGVRVESPRVFDETHALILDLVDQGVVDGLRVDHIDGLREPAGYLSRLAGASDGIYTLVEKILEPFEELPGDWPVAGTTGYDFLNRVNQLYVDSEAEAAFSSLYQSFTGEKADYATVVRESKWQIMQTQLAVEVQRLTGLLSDVCLGRRRHRDHTRRDLRTALSEIIANFNVYRTYVRPGEPPTPSDRHYVRWALDGALRRRPDLDGELVELIGRLALGKVESSIETEFCQRLQQLTAPVMAKGVEDTAFYRYNRFVSLNEVGGDPATFGCRPERFHRETSRSAEQWPETMLTLSTHDTKRSADVRARLNVLSELPVEWRRAVEGWASHNDRHRESRWPDRNTEYLLYQTLLGAWPIEADRVVAFVEKAAKEAKVHTSWVEPDSEYHEATERFVRALLADGEFVSSLQGFLRQHEIVQRGHRNSISQMALLLTSPGVPDIYQGTETWDFSLVDPDNRRPVDYSQRRHLLGLVGDLTLERARHSPGGLKLWLTHRLLRHRLDHPDLYRAGSYEPIEVNGEESDGLVGFSRHRLLVLARTRTAAEPPASSMDVPAGRWTDVLSGEHHAGGRIDATQVLGQFPVAVLSRDNA